MTTHTESAERSDAPAAATPTGAPPDLSALPDPRPPFAVAARLAGETIAGVTDDQLGASTPCDDFDVTALLGHLVAVMDRVAAVGRGEDPFSVPQVREPDGRPWAARWDDALAVQQAVWADDAILGRQLTLPFAVLPGVLALGAYVLEVTVHTWDLATATAQTVDWDPDVTAMALGIATQMLPAEGRGDELPFAAVQPTSPDAPPIEQVVAWMGRRP